MPFNGLGRYEEALAACPCGHRARRFNFTGLSLVEHVERRHPVRRTRPGPGSLARLIELTRAAESGWARGAAARGQALLADGDTADRLYRTAIEELERGGVAVEVARTHLLYGEWPRRSQRRSSARKHLRTAHEMFDGMRAHASPSGPAANSSPPASTSGSGRTGRPAPSPPGVPGQPRWPPTA
ncbi:hypothetical protein [Streptomyces sp. KL116D]|uniref:hypothetical protein n=1 Tax=Streptomyces sp. KL116D TaxID=3045152 RepID=UPI003556D69D